MEAGVRHASGSPHRSLRASRSAGPAPPRAPPGHRPRPGGPAPSRVWRAGRARSRLRATGAGGWNLEPGLAPIPQNRKLKFGAEKALASDASVLPSGSAPPRLRVLAASPSGVSGPTGRDDSTGSRTEPGGEVVWAGSRCWANRWSLLSLPRCSIISNGRLTFQRILSGNMLTTANIS